MDSKVSDGPCEMHKSDYSMGHLLTDKIYSTTSRIDCVPISKEGVFKNSEVRD